MPAYRLYLLNPHSGHIDDFEDFHSGDDVEAVLLVQNRERTAPMELWRDGTKVVRFDGAPDIWRSRAAAPRTNSDAIDA